MVDAIFKAGFYFIGDPDFVIREWDSFLRHIDPHRDESLFDFRKRVVAVGHTARGEGIYNGISIHSGMLAIVPAELIGKVGFDREAGLFIGFEEDFRVTIVDGLFVFGDIEIDTREEDDFEEQLMVDREHFWDEDDKDEVAW
jgi:hypothetical protein